MVKGQTTSKSFKAKLNKKFSYLRIKPINKYNAPARGATVI